MSPTVDDPLRAEVERRLRAALEAVVAAPFNVPRAMEACVRRRVETARELVAQPVRLVQSLYDLVVGAPAPADPAPGGPVVVDADVDVEPPEAAPVAAGGSSDALAIEEYESLAASHVVARLERLTPNELRKIRRFEAAHRGRRTVLGKIDQLLA